MAYEKKSIRAIIDDVNSRKVYLPAIQRKYVWGDSQITRLMDSIMLGYPIGTFLFWKVKKTIVNQKEYSMYEFIKDYHDRDMYKNPAAAQPFPVGSGDETIWAVLDGQQRLTSLYIALQGSIADLDDELESIQLYESSEPIDVIIVDWHSSNKINSIYMLYKNQYSGLDKASILDLVAADVIEEDYYFKDERFSIAPSVLTKQYCSIIEHEVNEIIQLLNLPNKPQKHLMWFKMKEYVKSNNIDLVATDFSLSDVLEDLYDLRNKGAHGDVITKDEYKMITQYKNLGLFDGISVEKLRLKNGKISPTIDELNEYMGLT